jgi:hypothetical protein
MASWSRAGPAREDVHAETAPIDGGTLSVESRRIVHQEKRPSCEIFIPFSQAAYVVFDRPQRFLTETCTFVPL